MSSVQLPPQIAPLVRTTVQILTPQICVSAQALIDSGSAGNFISPQILQELNVRKKRCSQDLRIHTIQGKPLGRGHIRHLSSTLKLRNGCLHTEEIVFMVLEGSTTDIILRRPWMSQHNPNINWNTGEILQWSESCFHTCLPSVQKSPISRPSKSKPTTLSLNSTTVESPEVEHQGEIPLEYRAFQDVFSKRLATQLPPHRPWDCAIDLLPGATLPKGRVYPLSIPEQKAMEEGVLSRSHNHHRLIATHRHQISMLHPLGHFPQSSDSRHLHLISTVTIKSHLSCKPLSGLVYTYSTDSLPDTNRRHGTLPIFCHPVSILYPSSASCLFLCKRETFPLPSAKSALDPLVISYSIPCLCSINSVFLLLTCLPPSVV